MGEKALVKGRKWHDLELSGATPIRGMGSESGSDGVGACLRPDESEHPFPPTMAQQSLDELAIGDMTTEHAVRRRVPGNSALPPGLEVRVVLVDQSNSIAGCSCQIVARH